MMLPRLITDLKIATALNPTPRVIDVPRLVIKPKNYTIVQNIGFGTISTSNVAPSFGAVYATLSQSYLSASFQTVFDSWRVLQFTVRLVPQFMPSPGITYPPLLTVIDTDDANNAATTNALRAYDTLQEVKFGSYVERTVNPQVALAAYSGTFTSYASAKPWIDVASPSVQWYGVKYGIDATTATLANAYAIEMDVVFQFRAVR